MTEDFKKMLSKIGNKHLDKTEEIMLILKDLSYGEAMTILLSLREGLASISKIDYQP